MCQKQIDKAMEKKWKRIGSYVDIYVYIIIYTIYNKICDIKYNYL